MFRTPAPPVLNDATLRAELAAEGVAVGGDEMHVDGGDLVFPALSDGDRESVERVVATHLPPDPPLDPDEEFRQAIEQATSVADLKAALLGTSGPGAEPRRQPR